MDTSHPTGCQPKKSSQEIIIPFEDSLAELERDTTDGWSTAEMSAKLGVGPKACREKIAKLKAAGKVESAGWKWAKAIDGKSCRIPTYRFIDEPMP
jgi:hypothetical protein